MSTNADHASSLDGICGRLDSIAVTLGMVKRVACDAIKDNAASSEVSGAFDLVEWALTDEQNKLVQIARELGQSGALS